MINSLSLTNFRSYADQKLTLDPSITVVVGPNATGKTNLLEAVNVLATTRSFRAKDPELINHGQNFFRLVGDLSGSELALGFQITDKGKEKRSHRDGAGQTLVQHLGSLQTVLFEPNDLLLIIGGPDRRRRYLDTIITQTKPDYLTTMHRYRRVLLQRNKLLSNWHGGDNELFAWDIKLTELAAEIYNLRASLIKQINEDIGAHYAEIAGKPEQVELNYQSSVPGPDYGSDFMASLEQNRSRDIAAGFTTIGPHREDFSIRFKENDINSIASRGEMRSVVLSLKLAELANLKERTGLSPVLLLDDVFSELDKQRRAHLIKAINNHQTIITTTDGDIAKQLGASHVINTAEL